MTMMSADSPPRSTAVLSPLCRRCTVRPPSGAAGEPFCVAGAPRSSGPSLYWSTPGEGVASSLVRTGPRPVRPFGWASRAGARRERSERAPVPAKRRTSWRCAGEDDADGTARSRAIAAVTRACRPARWRGLGWRPRGRGRAAPSTAGSSTRAITTLTAMTTASQPRPASTAAEKTVTLAKRPMMPGGSPARQSRKKARSEGGERAGRRTGRGSR